MISDKMADLLSQQMNLEFFSSYKYLAMSAYSESLGLGGFAHWFMLQSNEERAHAMKIYQYLLEQDCPMKLLPINEAPNSFSSAVDAMEKALQSEQQVTKAINELLSSAIAEKDYATQVFLQWFVSEQVEEEHLVRDTLERLELVQDSGDGLLLLDQELAKRE